MAYSFATSSSSRSSDFGSAIDSDFGTYHSAHSFAPLEIPYTSHLSMHDYHKFQHSPVQSPSPCFPRRRVRRKPSLADLAGRNQNTDFPAVMPARGHGPHSFTSGSAPELPINLLPPPALLPPFHPTTHSQSANFDSPPLYLYSNAPILTSTPSFTPTQQASSRLQRWAEGDLTDEVRTKRKFSSLKQAKRLPHHGSGSGSSGSSSSSSGSGPWQVFAAINHPPFEPGKLQGRATSRTIEPLDSSTYPSTTSPFTMSNYQFPPLPTHDCRRDPPTNPLGGSATILYRGVAFDVVNPHASLLLDGHGFETPAEMDGLVDDYFDNLTSPTPNIEATAPIQSVRDRRNMTVGNAILSRPLPPPPPVVAPRRYKSRRRRFSERSNPFDLSLDDGEMTGANIDGIAAPPVPRQADGGYRTLDSIIGRYELRRDLSLPDSSSSIERGRGVPAAVGDSSNQTYGDTNDLLQITMDSPTIPRMWRNEGITPPPLPPPRSPTPPRETTRTSDEHPAGDEADWETTRSSSRGMTPSPPLTMIYSPPGGRLRHVRSEIGEEIENRRQTLRAIGLLSNEISTGGPVTSTPGSQRLSAYERQQNVNAINEIRQTNPQAFHSACDHLVEAAHRDSLVPSHAGSVTPLSRRSSQQSPVTSTNSPRFSNVFRPSSIRAKYNPMNSFNRIVENDPSPVIQPLNNVFMRGRSPTSLDIMLGHTDTDGNASTITHSNTGSTAALWDPNRSAAQTLGDLTTPHDITHPRSAKTLLPTYIRPFANESQRSRRAAISGQYELQDLGNVHPNRPRTSRPNRMTDAQLAEREPNWTATPNFASDGPLAQHTSSNPIVAASQRNTRLLQDAGVHHTHHLNTEQKLISTRYLIATSFFPPLVLAFGLGLFDPMMAYHTDDRISIMKPGHKRHALFIYFPMSLMVYAIIASIVILAVVLTKH